MGSGQARAWIETLKLLRLPAAVNKRVWSVAAEAAGGPPGRVLALVPDSFAKVDVAIHRHGSMCFSGLLHYLELLILCTGSQSALAYFAVLARSLACCSWILRILLAALRRFLKLFEHVLDTWQDLGPKWL